MEDGNRFLESERLQIEHIRELESEELEVEEIDFNRHYSSSDESHDHGNDGGARESNGVTFDMCLASLHTYLGEVDDTHHRVTLFDGGAILTLPMFYLEGVVLFPESTLPLRVIHPNCKAAVERALNQVEAPYTIGVMRVHRHPDDSRLCFPTVGTTAEIRQYKKLEDGSVNIVARGQQRFRLRRRWMDVEGAPCAEVGIIEEDLPLRTPRDAFGHLASVSNLWRRSLSYSLPSNSSHAESDSDSTSEKSFASDLSSPGSEGSPRRNNVGLAIRKPRLFKGCGSGYRAPRSFLPHWVYRMFDSYCLAQRAVGMWKKTVGAPSMEDLVNKPDLLSFYIASKIPVSETTRQELLEINGVSYRLRREMELLESLDRVRCKTCQAVFAKRGDMLVMSSDGPLGAFVNPQGYVHEVMTLYNANGLALIGSPVEEYSWFPGYAWTIAICATCESQLGWLFTAINKKLKPKSFWGIRISQVADAL